MSFLAPAMLGFAAALPLVVALYFLKLHRAPKVVSSTYLWKRTIDAFRVNRPFDRFQSRLLLWVQLLVLALLVLALGRPLLESSEGESDVHVWLVDRSASMSAREGRTTRLEIAKAMLRDAVRAKRRADRLMIIGFSDRAEVACALTQDEGALLRAVDALAPTRRPTRLGDAWATALSVARQVDRSDVYILSDGRFPDLGRLTEANATVHYVPVGATDDNLGIVDVKVREADRGQAAREIFARVKSARTRPSTARVTLTLDGGLVDEQEVQIGPGESRGVVFRRAAGERGIAEVRIAERDALSEDDAVAVCLEAPEPASVLLVGPDDPFLREALARDPGVSLERVPASGFDARAAERDLVVVQGALPPSPAPLPRGTYLFMGALPPLDGFGPAAATATPVLEGWDKEHPLTRHLGFGSLHPASLATGPEPSWMKPLLWSDRGTVISAGEGDGYRLAVVRFPLLESDWPLRVSFPLFLANAVRWARDADAADRARRPGEPLVVRVPPGAAAAGTLVRPDGTQERIDPAGRRRVALSPIEETGIYRVRWEGREPGKSPSREAAFPVALADEDETDIRVAPSIAMGPAQVQGAAPRAITRREGWRWLAAAALALVLLEWLLYARGRRVSREAGEDPPARRAGGAPALAGAAGRGRP